MRGRTPAPVRMGQRRLPGEPAIQIFAAITMPRRACVHAAPGRGGGGRLGSRCAASSPGRTTVMPWACCAAVGWPCIWPLRVFRRGRAAARGAADGGIRRMLAGAVAGLIALGCLAGVADGGAGAGVALAALSAGLGVARPGRRLADAERQDGAADRYMCAEGSWFAPGFPRPSGSRRSRNLRGQRDNSGPGVPVPSRIQSATSAAAVAPSALQASLGSSRICNPRWPPLR